MATKQPIAWIRIIWVWVRIAWVRNDRGYEMTSKQVKLRASLLINWFPIQTSCVQLIFTTMVQYSKLQLFWKAVKSIHFEYPREEWFLILRIHNISMITIRSRKVNLRASVLIIQFRLVLFSWFFSLRCNVGSETQREKLSNPSILSMLVKNDFDKVNSQQSEEYHNFSISYWNE